MPVTHGVAGSSPVRTAAFPPDVSMPFYVYIIESETTGLYYKGFSENYLQRLEEHNSNRSRFTGGKGPWKLIYVEEFLTKKEALIREKKIKHANKDYLRWLTSQPRNLLLRK